jgi:hypothetical protein
LDISQHAEAAYGETWFCNQLQKSVLSLKTRCNNGLIRFYHIVFILSY